MGEHTNPADASLDEKEKDGRPALPEGSYRTRAPQDHATTPAPSPANGCCRRMVARCCSRRLARPDDADDPDAVVTVGSEVRLVGLTQGHYNGLIGIVEEGPNEKGR